VHSDPRSELVAIADIDAPRASALAGELGCRVAEDAGAAMAAAEIVIVSTIHRDLASIAAAAATHGCHVLVEKPGGTDVAQLGKAVEAAANAKVCLKVGYNHRFHPGIARAHSLSESGRVGDLRYVRCCYGHGGRPGYEREWRGDAQLSGGGELMDQGVHALDLFRWFLGEFVEAFAFGQTAFWDIAPLEDNCFAMLRTSNGQVAALHTSWTEWKNRFRFEVFGTAGSLSVEGLGGSYGPETLTVLQRRPQGGPPDETEQAFDSPDESWRGEWDEFLSAIQDRRRPMSDGGDALSTLQLAGALYRSIQTGSLVRVQELGAATAVK
jgi:predicted dehydrogenase